MDLDGSKLAIPHEKTSDSDTDSETPLQGHLCKALSLNNGTFFYKECLKNHAASFGGLALDGCGEFMPSPTATSRDPTSLKCAACGCHRSFHRRETSLPLAPHWGSSPSPSSSPAASPTPHHSIFPTASHMLLALSTGPTWPPLEENHCHKSTTLSPNGRKRTRTKFTEDQKEKMQVFAEKLGWKLPRGSEERLVQEFCSEVGINKNVFKIWMHNNKHRKDKAINHSSYDMNSNISDSFDRYQLETKVVHFHGSTDASPTHSS